MKRDVINYAVLKSILSAYEMKQISGGTGPIGPMCSNKKECSKTSDCTFDQPRCGCKEGGKTWCY
jgi:hypothetical protein